MSYNHFNKSESPRLRTPADHGDPNYRHVGHESEPRSPAVLPNYRHVGHESEPRSPAVLTSASQMASSNVLWGRDHGDKPSEKIGNSTYRQAYPTYPVDEQHERIDREKYRQNFGSLAERDIYRSGDEMTSAGTER